MSDTATPNILSSNQQANQASSIVSKVWSFCNTLRDDGVSYGDYLGRVIN